MFWVGLQKSHTSTGSGSHSIIRLQNANNHKTNESYKNNSIDSFIKGTYTFIGFTRLPCLQSLKVDRGNIGT